MQYVGIGGKGAIILGFLMVSMPNKRTRSEKDEAFLKEIKNHCRDILPLERACLY